MVGWLLLWDLDVFSGHGVFKMEIPITDMHEHVFIFDLINCTFKRFVDVLRCHLIGPFVSWFKQCLVLLHALVHGHVLIVIGLR